MYNFKSDKLKLYNKYRPEYFRDVVGQTEAISILKGLLLRDRVGVMKNFIFHSSIGGVGKTLLARIFAKAINCQELTSEGEPCGKCPSCSRCSSGGYVDYNEFNAADWNTVDKAKILADISKQMPLNVDGYRVIVIDEFQRVSPQGQDTLLKVLEEGAAPNIFLFCTTEYQNLRGPIRTRCFPIEIFPVQKNEIYYYLKRICHLESIEYGEEDLRRLSVSSAGSLREAVKFLELFYNAYGSVKNTDSLYTKYSVICRSLISSVAGRLDQSVPELSRLGGVDWVEDVYHVLWDLLMVRRGLVPEYLSQTECEYAFGVLEHHLDFIEREFSIYRPNSLEMFLLFLNRIQVVEESDQTPVSLKKNRRKRWATGSKFSSLVENVSFVPPPPPDMVEESDFKIEDLVFKKEPLEEAVMSDGGDGLAGVLSEIGFRVTIKG